MTTQVTVNNVRLAYMHLIEPRAAAEGAEPKYSVTMIIPKANTEAVNAVKAAMVAARDLKWGKATQKGLRSPLRDGDEKDEEGNFLRPEEFRNAYYVGASSKTPVPVKIVMGGKVVNCPEEHMVSGYYGSIQANFYGYDAAGNKGVSAGLNAVLITKRGEPLGRKLEWDDAAKAGAEDFGSASAPVSNGFDAQSEEIPF